MYDSVVIGGGVAGYVAAIKGGQMGGRIALIERDKLGGTCLNRGCIPTKALVRSVEVLALARRAAEFGIVTDGAGVDMPAVSARKARVVSQLVGGVQVLLKTWGVDVYTGNAALADANHVVVERPDGEAVTLESRTVLLATGSRAINPPIPGTEGPGVYLGEEALGMESIPPRLVVVGAGVIGMEFACVYGGFGSRVTVLEKLPGILPPVDEEISRRLLLILKKRGIAVQTGVSVEGISSGDGGLQVTARDASGTEMSYAADAVIIAVGRRADFGGIDLDRLGIAHDRKGITVDERMATSVKGVYAAGDVLGRTWLAHVATHEGLTAMRNIMGEPAEMDYAVVPSCVFSSPEIAWVGKTEREAAAAHADVRVSRFPFSANGRALILGESDGMVKAVTGPDGRLLGLHIMGPHADDLIHEGAAAIHLGATARDMADMIHSHPTLAEAVGEAFVGVDGSPIHFARQRR